MHNTHKTFIIALLLSLTFILPVQARDAIGANVPNAETVGQGRLRVFFLDVYDATLYAPNGHLNEDKPFAIELSYLRSISGKKIAERSAEEIRNQGFGDEVKLAAWYEQMRNIFPDVVEGDIITGVYTKSGETVFYRQDQEIGRIKDVEFSHHFFNIWLSENTSSPDLRRKLLGSS